MQDEQYTVNETLNPEQALIYLGTMLDNSNRRVNMLKVEEYARDMFNGRWKLSHEGIAFADGHLIDGQHRLWAVVEAMVPIRIAVTRNVDPAAFEVIDSGQVRTVGQTLGIKGEFDPTALADALGWQLTQDRGRLGVAQNRLMRTTKSERLATLERHPNIRNSIGISKTFPPGVRGLLPGGLLSWLHYQLDAIAPRECEEFFDRLRTGNSPIENDIVLKLRDRLIDNRVHKRRLTSGYLAAITIKAWNLFLSGDTRAYLVFKGNEEFPAICVPNIPVQLRRVS